MRELHYTLRHNLSAVLLIVTLMPITAIAGVKDDFNKGMDYFKEGRYEKATQAFMKAHKKGLNNAALHYNLGASYFKLKKYKQAEYHFKKALQFKDMKTVAEYNLGLIALKQGKKKTAQKYFTLVANSKNNKLVYLADKQLAKLSKKVPKKKVSKKWYNYASIKYGQNNNISYAPTDIASQISDSFIEVFASTYGILQGTYNNGVTLNGFIFHQKYMDNSDYNETEYKLGLSKRQIISKWRTSIGMYYDKSYFGGNDFQRIIGIEASAKKYLQKNESVFLRYRYNDITSLDNRYDYLEGWKQQLRGEFRKNSKSASWRLYYEFENNDRTDTVTRSYSPIRHTFSGSYKDELKKSWAWGIELSYRYSDYPSTPSQSREDDRLRAGLELTHKVDNQWKVKGKYRYTDNSSTDNDYDYTQDLYSISASYSF